MIDKIEEAIAGFVRQGFLKSSFILLVNPHVREKVNPADWLVSRKIVFKTEAEQSELALSETLYFLELFPAGDLEKRFGSFEMHGRLQQDVLNDLLNLPGFIEEITRAE